MTTLGIHLPSKSECIVTDTTLIHRYDERNNQTGFQAVVTVEMPGRREVTYPASEVRIVAFRDRMGQFWRYR